MRPSGDIRYCFGDQSATGNPALGGVALRSSATWRVAGRPGVDVSGGCADFWAMRPLGGVLGPSLRAKGLGGLQEGERPGRPPRLNEEQIKRSIGFSAASRATQRMRVNLWDGKTLAAWIEREYGIQSGRAPMPTFVPAVAAFVFGSPGRFWPKPTPHGRRRIKKTPYSDAGRNGRSLGAGRSAFPATGLPLPDVGAAGNQRPDRVSSPHPQERRLFRRRPDSGWQVLVSPRDRTFQRRHVLGVSQRVPNAPPPVDAVAS